MIRSDVYRSIMIDVPEPSFDWDAFWKIIEAAKERAFQELVEAMKRDGAL